MTPRTATFGLLVLVTASLPLENVGALPGTASVSKLLGLGAAAAWATTVLTTGRVRAPHTLHVVALLFVVWNACTLWWTVNTPATQTRVLTYAQLFVLLLVVWETVTTEQQVRQLLVADLVGSMAAATAMTVGYVAGAASSELHGRVTLGTFNPNDAGMILALALPIACYLLAEPWPGRHPRPVKVLAWSYLPIGTFMVFATGSRAALLAVVPVVWYGGRLLWRYRPVLAVSTFAGLGLLVFAALPLLPTTAVQRIFQTGSEVMAGNLNERQDVWAEAFRIIAGQPFTGIGAGAFRTAATGVNKVGHNFVLALSAETGVVGLLLFCAVMVVALRSLATARRALRELWWTVFIAWLFAALLHNWEYRKLTWLMFGLMVVCGRLADRADPAPQAPVSAARQVSGRSPTTTAA